MGGGEERLRQGCGGGHGGGGHRDGGEGRGSDGKGGGDGGIEDGFVVVVERCSTVLENSIAVIKKKWFMLAAKWYFDYLHSIACSFFHYYSKWWCKFCIGIFYRAKSYRYKTTRYNLMKFNRKSPIAAIL